jgi:hypothetical protein
MKFPLALFTCLYFSVALNAQDTPSVKVDTIPEKTVTALPEPAPMPAQNELKAEVAKAVNVPNFTEKIPVSTEDALKKAQSMGDNAANKTLTKAGNMIKKLPMMKRVWSSGSTNFSFVNSTSLSGINVALSPAFGYKITPWWSVGPRIEVRYGYMKGVVNYSTTAAFVSDVSTFSTLTYSGAAFTRIKVFGNFYLHGEVGYQSLESPMFKAGFVEYNSLARKVMKTRDNRPTAYVGIGYNNGGTDMLFLYNLVPQDKNNLFALPFDYRIGFTNNF